MGNRNVSTAIDLSGLGLDTVQELEDEYVIGCMTTLHDLEINKSLDAFTQGALRESLRHIVGVSLCLFIAELSPWMLRDIKE